MTSGGLPRRASRGARPAARSGVGSGLGLLQALGPLGLLGAVRLLLGGAGLRGGPVHLAGALGLLGGAALRGVLVVRRLMAKNDYVS